jgi:NAD-dependent deacetylase sirtuin 5
MDEILNLNQEAVKEFRLSLNSAKKIVVVTGAGVSAESGVPTFRGAGGYWRTYQATDLATPEAFKANPSLVWEFYHYRREVMLTKNPNRAHLAIAALQKHCKETGKGFTLITQNIDRLHQKAGSTDVVELHGSLWETRCTKCRDIKENRDSPICPALKDKGAPDPNQSEASLPMDQLPKCSCGGLLRPNVVWFNENLDPAILNVAFDTADKCDVLLVVGTSSVVYPAALIAPNAVKHGAVVAEFNIETTEVTNKFSYMFKGKAGVLMPYILEFSDDQLNNQTPSSSN